MEDIDDFWKTCNYNTPDLNEALVDDDALNSTIEEIRRTTPLLRRRLIEIIHEELHP